MTFAALTILGLALGSFVNAFTWRLKKNKDWVKARSQCTKCRHTLAALDLVPVFSWLWLRGRCRYCHKSISVQYPLVEIVTAVLFVGSYIYWPTSLTSDAASLLPFVVWLIAIVGLVAIAVYDILWMEIPDKIIYPLLALSIAQIACQSILLQGGPLLIRDAVIGLTIGGGIFYAIFQISKGKWIGGGDVKLGFALGLLLGARDAFIALYAASIIGAVLMGVMLAAKKITRKSKIPFGPLLILGAVIARLFGHALWQWYSHHLSGQS